MPQQPYASTDPNFGQTAVPPPAAPKPPTYASTDPRFGQPSGGGRGGGPGAAPPPGTGKGGRPAGASALTPPPMPFYPGGWKGAAQDFGGMVGGGVVAAAVGAALPAVAPVAGTLAGARFLGMNVLPKMLPMASRVARGVAGVVGAGVGGGLAAGATGSPLDTVNADLHGGEEDSVVAAFKRQAEMEAMGLGIGWGASFVGRRLVQSRVARYAAKGLVKIHKDTLDIFKRALEQTQDALRRHGEGGAAARQAQVAALAPLEDAALQAKLAATGAEASAAANKVAAERTAAQVPGVREAGRTEATARRSAWPTMEGPPGSLGPPLMPGHTPGLGGPPPPNYPARATEAVADVVGGPSMESKRQLGRAVAGTAESGPAIPTEGLRARLAGLSEQVTPSVMDAAQQGVPTLTSGGQALSVEQAKAILARNPDIAEALGQIPPELHLPAALSYAHDVVSTGPTIPFADAHKVKRLLDDVVNWDRTSKKLREQATKGFRNELRQVMAAAGHAPYEEASAAYREASRLFSDKGLAMKLQRIARENPDALVSGALVKPSEPIKLQMLKEVLTTHAEAGGGAAGAEVGQHAWQAVQSSLMYKHLIQPGIDQFDKSVAKMHPQFLHLLTEDAQARGVFTRLQTMSEAVKSVEGQTAQTVRDLGGQARQAREYARVAGEQKVAARGQQANAEAQASVLRQQERERVAQHAVKGQKLQTDREVAQRGLSNAREPSPAALAFADSSLTRVPSTGQTASDLGYAVVSPMGSAREVAGGIRFFLTGAKVNDLIQWASYSPRTTQMFVRAVTGPAPGQAIAAMIRLQDWMSGEEPPMAPAHQQPANTPPPGPRR